VGLEDELKGVRLEITRLMKQLMDSAALVYVPPVQSPHKTKTALDILLGEEDDGSCDDCEDGIRLLSNRRFIYHSQTTYCMHIKEIP